MDVILLEKVENLGNIGDRVKVRSGYGRNFLLPRGKATLATPANIAVFEARRAELEKKEAEELYAARSGPQVPASWQCAWPRRPAPRASSSVRWARPTSPRPVPLPVWQ